MSITFGCDVPREKYFPYADEPDYTESRPVAPFIEINVSNDNAYAFQRVLDPAVLPDHCGQWNQEKLACIHRRLMFLLNTDRKIDLYEEPYEDCQSNLRFYSMGRSEEYVTRRLREFLSLVTVALQHKKDVTFA